MQQKPLITSHSFCGLRVQEQGFPNLGPVVKNLPCNARETGSILVREDPMGLEATKSVRHNYWASALELTSQNCWAHRLQLLNATFIEPVLHIKRSHCNEKLVHRNKKEPPLAATRESPSVAMKT